MQINWLWLVVGLLPYSIKRQRAKNEQVVGVRALLWHLSMHWRQGHCSWELSFPLIEHWRR